jgi:MFS family permease
MMTGGIGPVAAGVVDVVHPSVRATAASVLSLTQNLFGLAAGPLLTGFLSDAYGLPFAMSVVPLLCVAAAAVFAAAARTYPSDLANVARESAAPERVLEPAAA